MNYSKVKNYFYLHLLFLYYSLIAVVSKIASGYRILSPKFMIFYSISILMIMAYAFFWQKILTKFTLVVAFSNKGIVMFWTLLWSFLLFNEKIKINNIIGMVIVIMGILMVVKND